MRVIDSTKRWIESMVIGLNLCPFARRVFEGGKIRYVVSSAVDEDALLRDFAAEVQLLADTPITEVETTLLIHPDVLTNFLDYNDFLDRVDTHIKRARMRGVLQVASFHPEYQFAETESDDVENYTNRSPYPMLHLLREASIDAVAEDEEALLEIPQRNIATLRNLGLAAIQARLRAIP